MKMFKSIMTSIALRLIALGSSLLPILDVASGQSRIIGGDDADPQRYPYYTALISNNGTEIVLCGGALITTDMILTAAHCVERGVDNFFVAVNLTDANNLEVPRTYLRKPVQIFIHPQRRLAGLLDRARFYNDIAIVRINDTLPSNIPIPRLNLFDSTVPNNTTESTLTGIGLGNILPIPGISLSPRFLQEVDLEYVEPRLCSTIWLREDSISALTAPPDRELEICADGGGESLRDTCDGDSGGPLIIRGRIPEQDLLVGVTTRGLTPICTLFPGVYARISGFKDWIQSVVCPNSVASNTADLCTGFDAETNSFFLNRFGFRFRADYRARFLSVLGGGCTSSKPVLDIQCSGGQLNIQGTSNDTIVCTPNADGSSARCINTCDDGTTPCTSVFVDDSVGNLFGTVDFRCESDDAEEVGGTFVIDPANDATGSCDGTSFLSSVGQNFRVGQLGAFCPGILFGQGSFSFSDYDFECGSGNNEGDFSDRYTCFEGRDCDTEACTIDFEPVSVTTDVFRLGCIQSMDGSPIPPRAPPPILDRPVGSYSARFRAHWQLDLAINCGGRFPRINITCENGDIRLIDTTNDSTNCTVVTNNVMECRETASSAFVNRYSSAIYECMADDAIPTTSVEYGASTSSCSLAFFDKVNRQKLQLDLFCNNDADGDGFLSDEFFVECEAGDFFEYDRGVYTCFEQSVVPEGALEDEDFFFETTRIETDFRWSNAAPANCFNFSSSAETAESSMPVVPSGTFCFSSVNRVHVNDGRGWISMSDLRVGDDVLVEHGKHERVYSFGHGDPNEEATFIQFLPSKLELSAHHLVFVEGSPAPIAAAMVKVGDRLVVVDGASDTVTEIRTIKRVGVYNPFTPSGTIVVNGIVASNYIAFQEDSHVLSIGSWKTPFTFQWLSHWFQAPHRIWCHWLQRQDYISASSGMSNWSERSHRVAMWFLAQGKKGNMTNQILATVGLIVAIALFGIFAFVEMLFARIILHLALVVGMWSLFAVARK